LSDRTIGDSKYAQNFAHISSCPNPDTSEDTLTTRRGYHEIEERDQVLIETLSGLSQNMKLLDEEINVTKNDLNSLISRLEYAGQGKQELLDKFEKLKDQVGTQRVRTVGAVRYHRNSVFIGVFVGQRAGRIQEDASFK
jgi:chromosome segregation ATPase